MHIPHTHVIPGRFRDRGGGAGLLVVVDDEQPRARDQIELGAKHADRLGQPLGAPIGEHADPDHLIVTVTQSEREMLPSGSTASILYFCDEPLVRPVSVKVIAVCFQNGAETFTVLIGVESIEPR